ncbi:hypothetical protein [Nocardioides convexus]|uniref:hypothetical protein n=1 Tax=Nocardioides convexus TaxID=2712224 RepID=UPI0031010315
MHVLVSNPPYVPLEAWESVAPEARDHDPHLALFSGDDGLDAIRVIARRGLESAAPGRRRGRGARRRAGGGGTGRLQRPRPLGGGARPSRPRRTGALPHRPQATMRGWTS